MKLEALTVCVGYADFLAETLPLNKALFDRLLVVSTAQDEATHQVCRLHHVQCVDAELTGAHGEFRKARGINAGLARLDLDGWVLHLDADIALPAQTREILERGQLNPACIYGVDRHLIVGYERWRHQQHRPRLQQLTDQCLVDPAGYPLGARLNVPHHHGWMPIGFFQLWHPRASGVGRYPTSGAADVSADRTDVLHSVRWRRSERILLPELIAYHLASETAPMGANWNGRTTMPFLPVRRGRWRRWWRRRHRWHHHRRWHRHRHHPPKPPPNPYCPEGAA